MDPQLTIIPPSIPHTHTVVFLHGRGDNAPKFAQSLQYSRSSANLSLTQSFPSIRWVFPCAPVRACASAPGQRLNQWFDICDVRDFTIREELQAVGLRESVVAIRKILAAESAVLGGKWERVILMGISQGAATAVHALLNLEIPMGGGGIRQRLGGFLGFSCRMPFPGRNLAETRAILGLEDVPKGDVVLRNTPILLEHCVDDPLVLIGNGRILRDTLRGFGARVEMIEYSDGGHWFNSHRGMDDAVAFLKGVQREISVLESSDSMDLS